MREYRHFVPEVAREISVFVNSGDLDDYRRQFVSQFPIPGTLRYLLDGVPPGRILDLGANIGAVAFFAAALGSQVLAVEALPENYLLLVEGVLANGFRNVIPCHFAASDGTRVLSFGGTGAWGHVPKAPGAIGTMPVPALAGDDILELFGFTTPDMVKIGVEGHEYEALSGLVRTLDTARPVIVLESNTWTFPEFSEYEKPLRLLRSHGYALFMYVDDVLKDDENFEIQEVCVANYFCVPRERIVTVRMPERRTFSVDERVDLLARDLVVPSPHWWHAAHVLDRFDERFPGNAKVQALKSRIAGEPDAIALIRRHTTAPPRWLREISEVALPPASPTA